MSNCSKDDYQHVRKSNVLIGRILRPHGTKGEVRLLLLGIEPAQLERLVTKEFFLLLPDKTTYLRLSLESVRFHKGVGLLKFSGIDSISDAEKLREAEVFISENDRPTLNEDEYYYDQLVGLKVLDAESGEEIGIVSAIVYGKGSESLELELSGTRVLLPIV
ncbi:16S rRNA processing protein RimM, partial [Candidatus Sumerlaeota bacterium]|nr:16S rRNA processing protein RimM [Candidatus Sumerlaeota bacterium]